MKALEDKPFVLIGSPMCTVYSTMDETNYARMAPKRCKEDLITPGCIKILV